MNPKIKDFLEKKPDITVVGLAWSLFWRFCIVYFLVVVAAYFIVGFIDAL